MRDSTQALQTKPALEGVLPPIQPSRIKTRPVGKDSASSAVEEEIDGSETPASPLFWWAIPLHL